MIDATIYGKGCCCDCSADTWEEVLVEAADNMTRLTNRVAKIASMHARDLAELTETLVLRAAYVEATGPEWWEKAALLVYVPTGPIRVIAHRDIPPGCVLLQSQEDIDEIKEHQAWARASKETRDLPRKS